MGLHSDDDPNSNIPVVPAQFLPNDDNANHKKDHNNMVTIGADSMTPIAYGGGNQEDTPTATVHQQQQQHQTPTRPPPPPAAVQQSTQQRQRNDSVHPWCLIIGGSVACTVVFCCFVFCVLPVIIIVLVWRYAFDEDWEEFNDDFYN